MNLFPITEYEGNYNKRWTRKWHYVNGAWQYFDGERDISASYARYFPWYGEKGVVYTPNPMIAGSSNDWGAYELAGVLQIDHNGTIQKICGYATNSEVDVEVFVDAGRAILERLHAEEDPENPEINNFNYLPDVYCIPGTGEGFIKLTLVTMNYLCNRTEVYLLGAGSPEWNCQLPGMKPKFRFLEWVSDLWRGICV